MYTVVVVLLLVCSTLQPVSAESDPLQEAGRTAILDAILQNAVRRELISGAVVLIGNSRETLYLNAVGKAGFEKDSAPLLTSMLFDVASLTKVFATTPAVVKLMDTGSISLLDPISRWYPEFEGHGITIMHLLTHTSGLHDGLLGSLTSSDSTVRRAAVRSLHVLPGNNFLYADINFILLGNLVKQVSGVPLDQFCQQNIYQPLGMLQTGFNPVSYLPTAATLVGKNKALYGVVQDPNARLLGGVAGHAGLFSSAEDLGRFTRMLLNAGKLNGRQILSERAILQMTAPYYFKSGKIVRGLGWDRESPFSAPKGSHFSEVSYGHTGYSGTSVWIDPEADLFVVLLTTRINYENRRSFNRLRSDISTVAAYLFEGRQVRTVSQLPQKTEP